eukprot:m.20047 g.20047  ORF g.20047 m.20047 type:complete len:201 (-) comp10992_c0_seq1:90-692(-)
MIKSLRRSLRMKKRHRPKLDSAVSEDGEAGEQELVIETKDKSLTGKVTDLGYSGTAIGGCGAAWTRGFSMEPTAQQHIHNLAQGTIKSARAVQQQASVDSLALDADLFQGQDGPQDSSATPEQAHGKVLQQIRARRQDDDEDEDIKAEARPNMQTRETHSSVMSELKLATPKASEAVETEETVPEAAEEAAEAVEEVAEG